MKILVFDFETTGLIPSCPFILSNPEFLKEMPHAVQFAFSVLDGSENVNYNYYLKVPVPIENVDMHGVTKEMSDAGVDFYEAFAVFKSHYDTSDKVVAHNIEFDARILRVECFRRGIDLKFDAYKHYCTMLEGSKRNNSKKWPKLAALYKELYSKTPMNMHDASVDVKACLRCYGALTSTEVPSAKDLDIQEVDDLAEAFQKLKV